MLKSEFEKLSGIVVSEFQYKIIEQEYIASDLDKAAFAQKYVEDTDGLATGCCALADNEITAQQETFAKYIRDTEENVAVLKKRIEALTAQLEEELEWQPYICPGEVQQDEYEHNKIPAYALTIEAAVEKVCEEYGFDPAKVAILTLAPAYEKNRHGIVRRVIGATIKRDPFWFATDDNYIRFSCAGYHYEMHNGELRRI